MNHDQPTSKRKQPKSRNGCITCKSKRRKCDETKPSCLRCRYQNIVCGGYEQGIKWRPVKKLQDVQKDGRGNSSADTNPDDAPELTQNLGVGSGTDMEETSRVQTIQPAATDNIGLESSNRLELSQVNPNHSIMTDLDHLTSTNNTFMNDGAFYDFDLEAFRQSHLDTNGFVNLPFDMSPRSIDLSLLFTGNGNEPAFSDQNLTRNAPHEVPHQVERSIEDSGAMIASMDNGRREDDHDSRQQSSGPYSNQTPSLSPNDNVFSRNQPFNVSGSHSPSQQSLQAIDTPESIRALFDRETCAILSIKEKSSKNPWRTLVWPLVEKCPALYHALAAMTCLHVSRKQPQLHSIGLKHNELAIEALNALESSSNASLETTLATRLALGFAESWDYQKTSNGFAHISAARSLVEQAISRHQASQLSTMELSRLSFLTNTWIYMNVLTRFTSSDKVDPSDEGLITACGLLSPVPRQEQIDPLMGCAITLFPLISRLADLVCRVRGRTEKLNSLDAISRATHLRLAIERWSPSIDVDRSEEFKASIADSIQTAEAYRWASLLLLRQTVPEVPWSHSQQELAQRTLVFLATIPLESPTTVVQIFPLLIAGTELYGQENRDWVRQRWDFMSKFMITGITERCLKVTEEVWRRRDEFEGRLGLHGDSVSERFPSPGILGNNTTLNELSAASTQKSPESRYNIALRAGSSSPSFPDSLAFKKGIDPMTRAGYLDWSVRGQLHWLTVMRDWNWEVMLG